MLTPALVTLVLLGIVSLFLIGAAAATLVMLVNGAAETRNRKDYGMDDSWTSLLEPSLVPEVAMIGVPPDASQESRLYIRRLLKLHFANYEVILVLDGPTDSDLAIWKEAFHLKPASLSRTSSQETGPIRAVYTSLEPIRLTVVDRQRGGEAACLNTGIHVTNAPVIGTVDVDAQFSEDALLRMIRPMVADPERTIAVCGGTPALPAAGLIARLYRLDSILTWLGRSAGLSAWNTLLPAPGSFLLLNREAVIGAGGFQAGALDMIVRLHAVARAQRRPYAIGFVPDPVSRLGTPASMKQSRALLKREQSDIGRALGRNARHLMGSGSLGWLALPGLLWASYLLPAVEIAGLGLAIVALALGWIEPALAGLLLAGTIGFEILVSMTAVILHEYALRPEADPGELVSLFVSAIPQNLGYRQVRSLWGMGGFARRAELRAAEQIERQSS
ncbi:MAG: glycosyltransferase family 2 protein [Acidobacteriia bacterium]|nr:glycosyltransferase family 2 protein [Terriglobia bacterium]